MANLKTCEYEYNDEIIFMPIISAALYRLQDDRKMFGADSCLKLVWRHTGDSVAFRTHKSGFLIRYSVPSQGKEITRIGSLEQATEVLEKFKREGDNTVAFLKYVEELKLDTASPQDWGERSLLIKCPDCKRDVSPSAPTCPQCGRPIAFGNAVSVSPANNTGFSVMDGFNLGWGCLMVPIVILGLLFALSSCRF